MIPNSPVRTVLMGAGFAGKLHLKAAQQLQTLQYVAVVDPEPASRDEVCRLYNIQPYHDLATALREQNAEAVDLCVPTNVHRSLIAEAAEAGVAILCEKPLALTIEDARAIEAMIDRHDARLMIAEAIRFWPPYRKALEIVRSEDLGRIRSLHLSRLSSPPPFNSWMRRPDLGGGAVLDLQIHDMTFVLQLLGRPLSISAIERSGDINRIHNTIHFSDDVIVTNRADFEMASSYVFRARFEIVMERGVLDFDDWRDEGSQLYLFPENASKRIPSYPSENPYALELDYFARCVSSGTKFADVPLEESVVSLAMCLASRDAHLTGRDQRL